MTNEEAINTLNSLKQYYNDKNEDSYVGFDNEDNEALNMAIKALEIVEEFETARIITGGRLNGRTYAYKKGLEDGKRKALEQKPCEDCISRTELLSKIDAERKYLLELNMDGAEHIIVHHSRRIIEDIPSVTPKTRWIPISEKPTEGTYLITGQYGKNRYVDISTFDGEDATDIMSWDSYSDEYKVNKREHKVIAYMPLPEPYREVNDDD